MSSTYPLYFLYFCTFKMFLVLCWIVLYEWCDKRAKPTSKFLPRISEFIPFLLGEYEGVLLILFK